MSVIVFVSVLSVVFTSKREISESNKDLKFKCRSINDFRHNQTQQAAVKQTCCW